MSKKCVCVCVWGGGGGGGGGNTTAIHLQENIAMHICFFTSCSIEPLSNFVPVRLFVEGCTYMSDPLQSKSHILRCNPLQVDKGYVLEYGHKRDLIVSCCKLIR